MLDSVLSSLPSRRPQSLSLLKDFLRFPSISTKPDHAKDVAACAAWLAAQFKEAGLTATIEPTPGHPIVLAKNTHQPNRPTILFYGHYDVQPPEPLDQWTSPPFEATERNGALYARGSADDKGQVWCHVEAIRAWQQHGGGLPVNVTCLIEGEEESGSKNLDDFIARRKSDLTADVAVISDTGQFARGLPAITYGLRGLVYMELTLTGPSHDLHSGMFGGSVANPANILSRILAQLHDEQGRITIPTFYDDVTPLTKLERDAWAKLPFDEQAAMKDLNVTDLPGEKGYTTLERRWARPTCDINGLTSGYQGHGAKTIIPSKASAKVSMRLVPHQDPKKIQQAFKDFIRARIPKGITVEFHEHGASPASVVLLEGKAMQLASAAVKTGFGVDPVYMREGGSIPVVGTLKRLLNIDTLLVGFGLPDDRVHSPNEKFDLDALYNGTRTAAALYAELATL